MWERNGNLNKVGLLLGRRGLRDVGSAAFGMNSFLVVLIILGSGTNYP